MNLVLPAPFGKYFLLEKIATGGMAEVFKAKTFGVDGFEKIVCIKKILSHWASDPEFIRMMIDEAKLCSVLSHPNIVQVLDLGSFENNYFIAMEYIDGYDLKTLLTQVSEKKEKIPADIACFIALQTLAGLDYAHKKQAADGNPLNIIHRDISPHNILLSYQGEVKITDFGIAKATQKQSFTSTGMLRGKYSYMSPEQVRSEALTPQSDVFSLGIVLFEMLTGHKCFPGDSEIIILDKIRSSQIKIEDLPQDIPGRLREIIAKALAQDLNERYPSAEALQMDLAQHLATIHPGFLPKDLASYLKPYQRPTMTNNDPSSGTQIANSKTSPTGIGVPPLPPSPGNLPPKKSNTALIIIMILLLLFLLFVGGGYVAWVYIIKPKMAPSPITTILAPNSGGANNTDLQKQIVEAQKTAQQAINQAQNNMPDWQKQMEEAQKNALQATQQAVNQLQNPELQKQIVEAQKAAQGILNQVQNNPELQKQIEEAQKAANAANNALGQTAVAPNAIPSNPSNPTPNTGTQNLALTNHAGNLDPANVPSSQPATPQPQTAPTLGIPTTQPAQPSSPIVSYPAQAQALISSTPQGAKIFVNDQATGLTTPATVDRLTLNAQYKIRLEKQGYYNLEAFVTPTSTTLQEVNLPLKELPKVSKPKARVREEGDFRLKQRPPPGYGGGGINVNGY